MYIYKDKEESKLDNSIDSPALSYVPIPLFHLVCGSEDSKREPCA